MRSREYEGIPPAHQLFGSGIAIGGTASPDGGSCIVDRVGPRAEISQPSQWAEFFDFARQFLRQSLLARERFPENSIRRPENWQR